jgi:ribosome-binding factor A
VGDEIRKVVSARLVRGLKDPLPGFVTVREVEVNRDFTLAKIYYSVIGTDDDRAGAQDVLDRHRGSLRHEVGKKIRLRNTPQLVFIHDDTGDRAARIHALLDEHNADESDDEASEEGEGSDG